MAFAPESAAEDATGIEETPAADAATFDIYTINGTRVRRNATGTAGLPRGIYVIKGRKVLVR